MVITSSEEIEKEIKEFINAKLPIPTHANKYEDQLWLMLIIVADMYVSLIEENISDGVGCAIDGLRETLTDMRT